ncbi:hypothetical protein DUT91_24235, partial [Phyllobacterium salinisoli]
MTRSGLLFDGKKADPAKIQENSNLIGGAVLKDVLAKSRVAGLNDVLTFDVNRALKEGGQSLAGWGGAFYYWNLPMSENPKDTVGSRIQKDPLEYEKFIALTSKAVLDTAGRLGISAEQFMTAFGAQAPEKVKAEVFNRVADYLDGTLENLMGNPDDIDGYKASVGADGKVSWYQLDKGLKRIDVTDATTISRLNTRRDLRLEKGIDHQWQADKAAADKAAADKAAADKAAADKAAADKGAAADKAAAEKAAAAEAQRREEANRRQREELQKRQEEERRRNDEAQERLREQNRKNIAEMEARPRQEEARRKEIAEERERERNRHRSGGGSGIGAGGTGRTGGIQVCSPSTGQCSGRPVFLDLNRDGVVDPVPLPEASDLPAGLTSPGSRNSEPNSSKTEPGFDKPVAGRSEAVTPHFDWNGDGVPDQTAWVGPNDGMLVIDLATDGSAGPDGQIDQTKEIAFSLWKT